MKQKPAWPIPYDSWFSLPLDNGEIQDGPRVVFRPRSEAPPCEPLERSRSASNCLKDPTSTEPPRIPEPSTLRHSPDSKPLALPEVNSSRTIPWNLHDSLTGGRSLPGSPAGQSLLEASRHRGVVVGWFRTVGVSSGIRGLRNPPRRALGQSSRKDDRRKRRSERALVRLRRRSRASCDRGLHERPMKFKVTRFWGEDSLTRAIILSGDSVPIPAASVIEGVGRTRP
jgi:hypothetical protein